MSEIGIPVKAFADTCHHQECTEPLPWDMAAVAINQTHVYCSPECATQALPQHDDVDTVTLHDPQGHADRPDNVSMECVDIGRDVRNRGDATRAFAAFREWHTGPFRVTPTD